MTKAKKKTTKKKVAKKKVVKKTISKKVAKKSASKKATKKKCSKKYIVHFDKKVLLSHVQANIIKNQQIERNQIIESMNFNNWLNSQIKLSFQTFKITFNDPVYRVYPKQWSVTSIIGSISDGARLNIGGPQVLKSNFPFNKFGALYISNTMNGAIAEYCQGTPLGSNDYKYTLQPQKNFELWDLDKVVSNLQLPSLKFLIDQLPIGGGWGNCKVPMPSQILSTWLKNIGGDGIIYTSTKKSNSKIIAIFTKDDNESANNFSIISSTNN